jgi:hypothetical protein
VKDIYSSKPDEYAFLAEPHPSVTCIAVFFAGDPHISNNLSSVVIENFTYEYQD